MICSFMYILFYHLSMDTYFCLVVISSWPRNWTVKHRHIFSCDQAALQMVFSVCLSHLLYYVPIIVSSWNFQELLPMTKVRSMHKVKVRGKRSRSQRSQPNFWTVTPVWIQIWWWNDAYSLVLLRRGALLFFKVMRQIARSHGSKNRQFWPKLGVSGLYLQFGITDGYEMMHKAWSNIEEVPYHFSRSSVKFKVTRL